MKQSPDQWRDHPRRSISKGVVVVVVGAASAIAQAPVAARIDIELADSACIVVRGSGVEGVRLRCTLVSCIVVSEQTSVRFVRTCTVMHKEQKEGKGKAHPGRGGTIDAVGRAS